MDRCEGRHQEPQAGPAPHHRRREGPHVPWAIAKASYKRQARNKGVTEIVKVANRGHALTIDGGWREVADTALAFVRKHGPKVEAA